MMYLSDCSRLYVTSNKLEEEVQELMKSKSRVLVDPRQIIAFQMSIIRAIKEKNAKYPRCKPVNIAFEISDDWITGLRGFVVRWNIARDSNGKDLAIFRILASK